MTGLQLVRALIIAVAFTISVPWAAFANDDLVTDAIVTTEAADSHAAGAAAADGTFSFTIAVGVVRKDGGNDEHVAFPIAVPIALSGGAAAWATAEPASVSFDGYGRQLVTISGTVPAGTAAGEYTINARGDAPRIPNLDNGNPVHLRIGWAGTSGNSADTTAPSITPTVTGTSGTNGWYTSDVTVTWTVTDPESTVTSTTGCESATLTASGSVTCSATSAGGATSATVTVQIDTSVPTVTASASTAANGHGWYNTDVTITFACADLGSGLTAASITACAGTQTLTASGSSTALTVTDIAGNSTGSNTVSVQIDKVAPTITAAATTSPNGSGWYNTDVTVTYACADSGSGLTADSVAACAGSETLTASGSSTALTVSDHADNSTSSNTVSVQIDKVAPTITFGGNAGTYDVDQAVAITCTAADEQGGSGLASSTCPGASGLAYTFGTGSTTLGGTAADVAGNTASGSASFTVRATATGLCNLTKAFASKPLGNSLCAQLNASAAAKARGSMLAAANAAAAYVRELQAQTGKAFTPQQTQILIGLLGSL